MSSNSSLGLDSQPRAIGQGATIHDVARLAQVSIKTVSRVMNNETNVREETRIRVKEAARSLKYSPNLLARSLAGSRSYLIGLLYDNPNADYIHNIQSGIIRRAREDGVHLLSEPQNVASPSLSDDLDALFSTIRLDGVILSPPLSDHPIVLEAVERAGISFVRISPHSYPNRGASVKIDERAAAKAMTEVLIKNGHRQIGFVMGHPDHGGSVQRYEGFNLALRAIGLEPRTEWVKQGYFTFESGREAARSLLGAKRRPTAIFAANDDMAFGVMAGLQDEGLSIPDDMSVVGYDDNPGCKLVWPHLSTIHQPIEAMAYQATDLLLKPPQGLSRSYSVILPHSLIERQSIRFLGA
jgi:LacI family transcriptional regulator